MEKFYLVKEKTSPYYQVYFIRDGRRTKKSTKEKTKSEALKFLTRFKEKMNQKRIIPKIFVEFEREYISWISDTHSKSYLEKSVKLAFRLFNDFVGKDIFLTDISANVADRFFSFTFSRAEYAARLYLRTLKSAFNTAIRWGLVETNVFTKIKAPKAFKTFPLYIKQDELQRICNETKEFYLKNLFLFAFLTGARLGEVISLRWKNINLEERTIMISNSETFQTKNKQDRIIPINNQLTEILNDMKLKKVSDSDFVFYKVYGVKLDSTYVSKKFKKAVVKCGLSDQIHFHTLRHSFASLIHQRGASLTVIKDLLGHQDLRTTLIYSHMSKENLVNAVELIGKAKPESTNKKITAKGVEWNINLN